MYKRDIELLVKRIELLESKVLNLESTLETKDKIVKRPYKWKEKVIDTLSILNTMLTKQELCNSIIKRYGEELNDLDKKTIGYRLSSSYARMKQKDIVMINSNIYGEETVIGLKKWFTKSDSVYKSMIIWFARNDDYEFPRT